MTYGINHYNNADRDCLIKFNLDLKRRRRDAAENAENVEKETDAVGLPDPGLIGPQG